MKIHIVGAGPSGMSLAWEILRAGDHDITIYDRKPSAGGSWWEPDVNTRDLHAHRIVFDRAFVNTHSLFEEMGIQWDDIFEPTEKDLYSFMLRSLKLKDYGTLASLATRVLTQPDKYKSMSLKEALGELTPGGQAILEHLPLIMDGVPWNVMSAYEFVKSFDHVALSKQCTQKVSGKVMCDLMHDKLLKSGVNFVFNTELENVEYLENDFVATFSDKTVINDGFLVLCIDNSQALKFLGNNWGPDADKKVRASTYGCINVLLDFDETPKIGDDLEIAASTPWNLQPVVLSDGKTVSCVICDLTDEILKSNPDSIKEQVVKQLNLPAPQSIRFGWGATWDGEKWQFSQSSGVLSLHGQLPFIGECPRVAMCGMMSPRHTPYSSIEAAIEVSRSLSRILLGTREPLRPRLLTHVIAILITVLIVLILMYINRNQ